MSSRTAWATAHLPLVPGAGPRPAAPSGCPRRHPSAARAGRGRGPTGAAPRPDPLTGRRVERHTPNHVRNNEQCSETRTTSGYWLRPPPGRPGVTGANDRRAQRRQETKDEIVAAAWDLVREQGLAGLAMRDLGARVGMRAQSIYSYFESKHEIYDAMFREGYLDLRRGDAPAGRRRGLRLRSDRRPTGTPTLLRVLHLGSCALPAAVPAHDPRLRPFRGGLRRRPRRLPDDWSTGSPRLRRQRPGGDRPLDRRDRPGSPTSRSPTTPVATAGRASSTAASTWCSRETAPHLLHTPTLRSHR